MNTVQIYAAGGAGINISSFFEKFNGNKDKDMVDLTVSYLDTSSANLAKVPDSAHQRKYLVDGAKIGSGKVRRTNLEAITESVKEMLLDQRAGNLNIVISSASGGSGSVIGPLLTKELLTRGENVVVFLVGSTDSAIELKNTANTIRSYEKISKDTAKPVVCYYLENGADGSRDEINEDIHVQVANLCALFSADNHEIDQTDLENFLNYTTVTDHPAHLVAIEFHSGNIDSENHVISVASLVTEKEIGNIQPLSVMPDYQTTGIIPNESAENIRLEKSMHFAICDGSFEIHHQRLAKVLNEREKVSQARVDRNRSLSRSSSSDDGDLVI